eukprot:TRINITY_DN4303_c2_g1_i1.p1 TRINITY_DN4303_c2_g1~~TRINITY_DN4303_c2_g1_i1.p1  ORF type:complete len:267 (-),score=39.07 TRINITY_DN4303_c2_g1_i1:75-875(-)
MALKRLQKEQRVWEKVFTERDFEKDEIPWLVPGDDLFFWEVVIIGPKQTPYEGGLFRVEVRVPREYPFKPPRVRLCTPIYHCGVNEDGSDCCLDILGADRWSPAQTISKVILSYIYMMSEPNPDDPMRSEIAHLYKTDRVAHDQKAREWAKKYADAPIGLVAVVQEVEIGSADACVSISFLADTLELTIPLPARWQDVDLKVRKEKGDRLITLYDSAGNALDLCEAVGIGEIGSLDAADSSKIHNGKIGSLGAADRSKICDGSNDG